MKLNRTEPDIETLVSRIRRGDLDLQPSFQRGEIWDTKRQQRLVDTILRRWYVPAVHVVETDEGQEVLDGQQRLAAIRDFVDNKIRVNGAAAPKSAFIESLDGKRFQDLPDPVRRAVQGYVIPVIVLSEYEPDEPNELFFRLNQAYNLTPPEKRNALHGPARDQVRSLVTELTHITLLDKSSIGFNNSRLAYDDIISRACVSVEMNTLRRHINNDTVETYYRMREGFSDRTYEYVLAAGRMLLSQIQAAPKPIKFNKGTLQTWLVYCAWAVDSGVPLAPSLLGRFESERVSVRKGEVNSIEPDVAKILALYDDRASYRVTDVSSVLIRDLAVHLYSEYRYGVPSLHQSSRLRSILSNDPTNAQPAVLEYIDEFEWGSDFLSSNFLDSDSDL